MKRNMKKGAIGLLAGVLTVANCITSFAGEWKQDDKGWYYQKDDGSYYHDGWECIDANNDGVGELYYFTEDGYLLTNTTTPDGMTVNGNGARVVDGEIIVKKVTKTSYNPIQDSSLLKVAGCSIDSLPVLTGLNRLEVNPADIGFACFLEVTDKHANYWWPETYKTGLSIKADDREAGKSDADIQKSIYDYYCNGSYKASMMYLGGNDITDESTSEYNIDGHYWVSYSYVRKGQSNRFKDHNIYKVIIKTFSPTKQYQISYTADLNRGGKKVSPEDLVKAIHITDDFSTIWLNADGDVTIETDAANGQEYFFNLRK